MLSSRLRRDFLSLPSSFLNGVDRSFTGDGRITFNAVVFVGWVFVDVARRGRSLRRKFLVQRIVERTTKAISRSGPFAPPCYVRREVRTYPPRPLYTNAYRAFYCRKSSRRDNLRRGTRFGFFFVPFVYFPRPAQFRTGDIHARRVA